MPGNQLSLALFPQAYIAPIAVSLQAYVYTKHYIKLSSLAKERDSVACLQYRYLWKFGELNLLLMEPNI